MKVCDSSGSRLASEYRKVMNELLGRRAAAMEQLSQDIEAQYAQRLDDIWWELSDRERELLEKEFGHAKD